MNKEKKKSLGRGLFSLMENTESMLPRKEGTDAHNRESVVSIDINNIYPDPEQPRKNFSQEAIEELASSINENGVIVPILVCPEDDKGHKIIAGERRYRAAKLAGLKKIPAVIRNLSARRVREFAIIENVQRQDLNAMEEAKAYQKLITEFGYNQAKLSDVVGKSRSHIANILRLIKLPDQVQELIVKHGISVGHAKALMATENPLMIARAIVEEGLNVRQVEQLAKNKREKTSVKKVTNATVLPSIIGDENLLAEMLTDRFNTKIEIKITKAEEGMIVMHFADLRKLDELLGYLTGETKK